MYRHLLVPLDGSPLSSTTVDQAIVYAGATGARLTFFHARPDLASTGEGALLHAMSPEDFATFIYGVPTGIGMERSVYRKNWGRFVTPAVNFGAVEIRDPNPPVGARAEFCLYVVHLTTPISPTRTRYWWFQAWNVELPADFMAKWQPAVEIGYAEDKAILNHVQRVVSADAAGCEHPEVLAQADQAAIQARRNLQALLDAEREGSTA
jgi:nucleotide-binding universal stress UspA family protein